MSGPSGEILGNVALAFLLTKGVFSLLGWYSKDGTDPLYRRGLDAVWDRLHELSWLQLVQQSLIRILRKVQRFFASRTLALTSVWIIGFVANAAIIFLWLATLTVELQMGWLRTGRDNVESYSRTARRVRGHHRRMLRCCVGGCYLRVAQAGIEGTHPSTYSAATNN